MDDKLNKLFTDFVGKDLLSGITADNFDSLRDISFITPENMNYIRDMLTVGWMTGQISSSGPMPNTQEIKVGSLDTSSGGTVAFDLFVPNIGEVYEVQAIDWLNKNSSSISIYIEDTITGDKSRIDYQSSTASTVYSGNIFVTYPCKIAVYVAAPSGLNKVSAAVIRVR